MLSSGQTGHPRNTGQTSQRGQTGQTELTFIRDFPVYLCRASCLECGSCCELLMGKYAAKRVHLSRKDRKIVHKKPNFVQGKAEQRRYVPVISTIMK